MPERRPGRLSFAQDPPGGRGGGDASLPWIGIGGYRCHLAQPVARDDLRRLVATLDGRGRRHLPQPGGDVLGGRSAVWRHDLPPIGSVVIKEYRHGGLLRFIRRRYYARLGSTRPEREFRNLLAARDAGLNVPEPVAGISKGLLIYRGWLVTRRIEGRTLVEVVRAGTDGLPDLLDDITRQVGLLIARRVAHVDLHPGNVFIGREGRAYLLDFDRARLFRAPVPELVKHYDTRWKRAVEKHGLPAILADRFSEGLSRFSLTGA